MAKLTTNQRKKIPTSDFGLPGKRAYPINNKAHAANAKSRAAQFASPSQKKEIDAKADAILGKSRGKVHTGSVHTKSSQANGGKK